MIFAYLFLHVLSLAAANEVSVAPEIEIPPKNQTVVDRGVAFFLCMVNGTPDPKIEWKRNHRSLFSVRYTTINFQNGSVLRIEPVRKSRDEAEFECVAENGIGEPATASAFLTVLANLTQGFPVFASQREFVVTEPFLNVSLPCKVDGTPKPTVTWLKDMVPVDMRYCRYDIEDGSLNIAGTVPKDEGTYECVAENSVGLAVQSPVKLYVKVRKVLPQFVVRPDPLHEVISGSSLNITCAVTGVPMPSVKWQIGSFEIVQEHDESTGKNTLILENITSSANYTCMAESTLGFIEATTEIRVKEIGSPAKFTILPNRVYEVTPGSDLNLTCAAVGDPVPTVAWYIGCIDISPIGRQTYGPNLLMLENITLPANYTCVAISDLGVIKRRVSIVLPNMEQYMTPSGYPKTVNVMSCPCEYVTEIRPEKETCIPVYKSGCACMYRFVCPEGNSTIQDVLRTPMQKCVYEGKTYSLGEEIKTIDCCAHCLCRSILEGAEMMCDAVECPQSFQLPPDKECYNVYEDGKCCPTDAICVPTEPEMTVSLTQVHPQLIATVSWSRSTLKYDHLEHYRFRYGRTNTSPMEEIILDAGILNQTISDLDHGTNYTFLLSARNKLRWSSEAVAHLSTPQADASLKIPPTVLPTDLALPSTCPKCEFRYLKHYQVKNCFPVYLENCSCPIRFDCPNVRITPENVCVYKGQTFELGEVIPTGNPCQRCKCRYKRLTGMEMSCSPVECPSHFRLSPPEDCYEAYEKDKCCPVLKCPEKVRERILDFRSYTVVEYVYYALEGGKVVLPCDISIPLENDRIDLMMWFNSRSSVFALYTIDATKTPFESAPHYTYRSIKNRAVFHINAEVPALVIEPVRFRDYGKYLCRVDFDKGPTRQIPMFLYVEESCTYEGKIYHVGERIYPKIDPCLSCVCNENWTEGVYDDCEVQECLLERQLRYLRKGCIPIYHESKCCPIDFYCGTEDTIPNNNSLPQSPDACVFEGKSYSVGEVLDIKDPTNCITCTCQIPPDFTCVRKGCPGPPNHDYKNCTAVYHEGECCPTYDCLKPLAAVACEPVKPLNGCQEVTGRNGCPACLRDKLLCNIPKCPDGCEVEYDVPSGTCPRCRCSSVLVQLAPARCSPVQCDPQCFEVSGSDGCLTCVCGPLCSPPKCGKGCVLQVEVPQGQCRGCVCPADPNQSFVDGILQGETIKCSPVTCSPACNETVGKYGCPTCICEPCPPLNCSSGCELESTPPFGQCPKCLCVNQVDSSV